MQEIWTATRIWAVDRETGKTLYMFVCDHGAMVATLEHASALADARRARLVVRR